MLTQEAKQEIMQKYAVHEVIRVRRKYRSLSSPHVSTI